MRRNIVLQRNLCLTSCYSLGRQNTLLPTFNQIETNLSKQLLPDVNEIGLNIGTCIERIISLMLCDQSVWLKKKFIFYKCSFFAGLLYCVVFYVVLYHLNVMASDSIYATHETYDRSS